MAEGAKVGTAFVEVVPKVDKGFKERVKSSLPNESDGGKSGHGLARGMKAGLQAGAVALGNIISNVATSAASTLADTFVQAFDGYAQFEQLSGGVEKIFDQADTTKIMADAQEAFKDLNMSANEYLASINQTGAAFAQTMGDQKGYDTARNGMLAISDYASGTGRNLDELNDKYALITRSTASYQSIADQFSGILPATSADFLAQAQAAGFLSDSYTKLTEVPIEEYQAAVTDMLQKGVSDMGLAGNTAHESATTVSGSIAMMQKAWENWLVALGRDDVDMGAMTDKLIESIGAAASNAIPLVGRIVQSMGEAFVMYAPVLYDNALVAMSQIAAAAPDVTPQVVAALVALVSQAAFALVNGAPALVNGALQMAQGIVMGLLQSIPQVLATLVSMIPQLVMGIASGAGQMLGGAMLFFDGISQALVQVGAKLGEMVVYIVTHLPEIFMQGVDLMFQAGQGFLDGLIQGFTGGQPQLDGMAAQSAKQMADSAKAGADGTAVAQQFSTTLASGFDMSQFQTAATDGTKAAIDAAALTADAAPISAQLAETADATVDRNAMDKGATAMVENAVKAASGVDASEIGKKFSSSAASGVDSTALSKAISSTTASVGKLNQTATVKVRADLSGIKQLQGAAQAAKTAYSGLGSSVSNSLKQAGAAAANAAKGVKDAVNKIPTSRTIKISVSRDRLPIPVYSVSGTLNPMKGTKPTYSLSYSYFAEGGILTKPVFVAGEAGPEAVLPLTKLAGMLDDSNRKYSGGMNITVNARTDADPDQIAGAIARKMRLIGYARG